MKYSTGPDAYLQLIADAKRALRVPVIASLNGYTPGAGPASRASSRRPAPMRSS